MSLAGLTLLLALYAPGMPWLPPAQPLAPVEIRFERGVCVAPTCGVYPTQWHLFRNGRFDRADYTTFMPQPEGDSMWVFFRSTATRSIAVAAANHLVDYPNVRVSVAVPLMPMPQPVIVRNPTQVRFPCGDHAQDTGHEIDIIRASDGLVIQTLTVGDPPADSQGIVTVNVNVQPIQFGQYVVRVRAIGGGVSSPNSPDSDVWERSPIAPGKPQVQ